MQATKCVWQYHDKKADLLSAFDYFRSTANEAIRIGVEKNLTSKFNLHYELYYKLRSEFHSKYVYGALECAASKLKHFRKIKRKSPKAKMPYIYKNHILLDNQSYEISDGQIRIPVKPRNYCIIKLNHYVLIQIQDAKLGSITITEDKLIISYSKQTSEQKPTSFVAVDRNLDNTTTFDTQNKFTSHNLRKANDIKQSYKQIKSKFRRNDVRIRKKIFAKYGKKEKNRVHDILHQTSKKIVNQNMGIIMEDLKGIRKLYQKGNGQGKKFRAKMNSWSFYELQRQIEYKARWLGLPIIHVKASGTSSKCATCGSKMVPEEHRMLFCSCCNVAVDRDINAAKNILARGTRVVPVGTTGEAMMRNVKATNPQSRCGSVVLSTDKGNST
jgi:putative transposase